MLWRLLTDKNARDSNDSDQTDSEDDVDGNDKFKERDLKKSSWFFQLTCIILMDQTYHPVKLLI